MIDAALAAAIAAPVAPSGEPAPAEGFGDLLSQMLGAGAQPGTDGAQEPAEALDPMAALLAAQAAASAATVPAATVPAAVVPAEGTTPGTGRRDAGEQTVTEPAGKAASSAWHASPAARAHASAHSAVVLAAAAQVAMDAARQSTGQDTGDMNETVAAETPVLAIQAAGQAAVEAISGGDAAEADRAELGAAPADTAGDRAAEADAARSGSPGVPDRPRAQAAQRDVAASPRAAEAVSQTGEHATPVESTPVIARAGQRVEPAAAPIGVDGGATRAADHAGQAAEVRPAGPPTELFASGALRRVMEAIEAAEHRPPPNTMAVEIPGEGAEGALRLMVSVRGSVVEITAQGDRVLPPGWARPLADALAQRGMSLDGFSGQDAAGRQDGAAEGRDGQAARDERAARRAGVAGVPAAAPRPLQSLSTGHDGALRL